jgi:hypothetical protein
MKRNLVRALVVLSGVLLALGAVGTAPAQAAGNPGGINVEDACHYYHGGDLNWHQATVGTTAYDWRCKKGTAYDGINMPGACHYQYAGIDTVDRIANFYDITSWQCWQVKDLKPAGGLNLTAYCQLKDYDSAKSIGTTVYDWRCVKGGTYYGIDIPDACRARYDASAVDRFRNFYDLNSWECYV